MADVRLQKQWLDDLMRSVITAPQPDVLLVSNHQRNVFSVFQIADTEMWNWRRTKRELRRIGVARKGVRREYHRHG